MADSFNTSAPKYSKATIGVGSATAAALVVIGYMTITSYISFDHIATPTTPAAGKLLLYAKSDNKFYTKNSSGTETELGSGGGGGGDGLPTTGGTMTGDLTLANTAALVGEATTPTTLTVSVNDYAPATRGYIQRWSSSETLNINGLSLCQVAGQCHRIINAGSSQFVLGHEITESTAANRFFMSNETAVTVNPGQSVEVTYDGVISRWRINVYRTNDIDGLEGFISGTQATVQYLSEKNMGSGYAGLDGGGKLPQSLFGPFSAPQVFTSGAFDSAIVFWDETGAANSNQAEINNNSTVFKIVSQRTVNFMSLGIRLAPSSAPTPEAGLIYFDSGEQKFKVCEDGSTFVNLIP